ncbi:hypothetical protein C4D60_Mb04t24780 [Musa balbisiana]|uniref:Uncharacterized protein n=1 Tax=Musa balbisiana TaxID=52838 RepID=A0A4S8KEF4_MUSBA|nr:hypothetical protein C4D60_Mb04t24780 [Musa balbisiana]
MGGEDVPMEVTNAGRVDSVTKLSSTRVSHLGRSKSASDRNLELTKSGKSHSTAKNRTEYEIKQLQMHLHQENSFSAGEGNWLSFQYFYLLDIDIFLLSFVFIEDAGPTNILLKSKVRHDLLSRENMNLYVGNDFAYPMKEKLPTSGRGHFTPILKDHLYRCPSRISEEMVRCMASIFCWMCIDSSEMSGKLLSSFFSRSSSSVVLPPRGTTEEQEWPRRSTIEITSIRIDKQCPRASYVISDYSHFWNSFCNFIFGGQIITANCIEYSRYKFSDAYRILVVCFKWLETILTNAVRKKCGEEKQLTGSNIGLSSCQPLVFFGLCTGASSDPMFTTCKLVVPVVGITTRQLAGDLDLPLWLSGGAKVGASVMTAGWIYN